MTFPLSAEALRAAFEQFRATYAGQQQSWRENYQRTTERIRTASAAEWMAPSFQRELWEESGVAGIGPGSSVTVTGAYADAELATFLLQLRDTGLPQEAEEAARAVEAAYDEILSRVRPRYTQKRPRARIVRLLAGLYPHHMTCLMDRRRTEQVQKLVGARRLELGFVGQNPMIRARLREVLADLASDDIEQAMFSWVLWETHFLKPEPGAVETVGASREAADVPEFSLLPAVSQRRSLFAVQNNVSLLASVVRECEQGIGKDDLISLIQQEAPQLSESSANNVINQALGGGLGLIRFVDGAYLPTERGFELLNAPDPGHVLRAPLVGRVFGMGHLLRRLLKHGPMSQQAAAQWLQKLVPTWTSTMPGSYIVLWAKLSGLVQAAAAAGGQQISLTEDGEDYALALPDDFEDRWRIEDTRSAVGETVEGGEPQPSAYQPTEPPPAYDTAQIVAEGCFMPKVELDDLLVLLERKKNLVLQGPPGTGKTWLARRLAYALVGAKDPARVTALQFQPSLSYEDFVRGWRPYAGRDGQGGLRLTDGIFLECVQAALSDPAQKHVVVIEEINRGNPAQILGELLTLLEADKRTPSEELRLAYPKHPDERVHIPPNLYVIGTMNIADRSLALVDLALRRRFAFRTLQPTLNQAWRAWCLAAGAPAAVVDVVQQRIGDLNAAIAADPRLKSQFCVGHSFVTPPSDGVTDWAAWYRSIIEAEIGPLLDEYWYDDEQAARAQKAKLLQPL
jgi:5-methylcytosine-specific restriction enzyme B